MLPGLTFAHCGGNQRNIDSDGMVGRGQKERETINIRIEYGVPEFPEFNRSRKAPHR